MFGKNKLYSVKDFADKNKLFIKDIWPTIQGEGIFSGHPSTFIRLGYCNLACFWCDTDFESDVIEMSIDDIIAKIKEITPKTTKLIVITGAEPLLQPKVSELIKYLLDLEFKVQVETAGTICPPDLPLDDPNFYIICSPKTGKLNSTIEQHIDAYKYIINSSNYSEEDGLPIYSTQVENMAYKLARPVIKSIPIYISPMDEYDKEKNDLNMKTVKDISLKHGYLVSLQIHKILNVP